MGGSLRSLRLRSRRHARFFISTALTALKLLRTLRHRRRWPKRLRRDIPVRELANLSDQECRRKFRFTYDEIVYLTELLDIPDPFFASTRRLSSTLALAMLLNRLSGTRALHDCASYFNVHHTYLCHVVRRLALYIVDRWHDIVQFNLARMKSEAPRYASRIAAATNGVLENCIGFIDGTNREIARPTLLQQTFYSGSSLTFFEVDALNSSQVTSITTALSFNPGRRPTA